MGYAREIMKSRLKPVRRLSDDLSFTKTTRGQSPRYGWLNASPRLQNSSAENAKRSQLIITKASGVVGFSNPTFWALLQWIAMTGMLKILSDTSIRPTLAEMKQRSSENGFTVFRRPLH